MQTSHLVIQTKKSMALTMVLMGLFPSLLLVLLTTNLASATPLAKKWNTYEFALKMEPEKTTFLCYCEYNGPLSKIQNLGCETPGREAKLGNIVTATMIDKWKQHRLNDQNLFRLKALIRAEPLNITVFNDTTINDYSNSQDIKGTIHPIGAYGACRFKVSNDNVATIPTGRTGEVARTALYLDDAYHLEIPKHQRESFIKISKLYPPTERETMRNQMAFKLNGSWNHWVETRPPNNTYNKALQSHLTDLIENRGALR
jgi:hypothetical protein